MRVVESPLGNSVNWKEILAPKVVSDVIPEGFEAIDEIAKKLKLSRAAVDKRLRKNSDRVEMKIFYRANSTGKRWATRYFRPKDYESIKSKKRSGNR